MSEYRPANNCDWFDERLEPWLDGELPADQAEALERHVDECRRCLQQYRLARRIQTGLQGLEQPSCPDSVIGILAERTRPRRRRLAPALAAGLMASALGLGVAWQMHRAGGPDAQPSRAELAEARAELGVALGYVSAAGRAAGRDVGSVLASEGVMRPIRRGLDLEVTFPVLDRESHDTVESET